MSILDDPDVTKAIKASALSTLPAKTVARLFQQAVLIDVPSGAVPQRQGDGMVPGFMVAGLLRAFQMLPDGRQLTVRYIRAGGLLAIATLYTKRTGPLSQQALSPCRIVRFSAETLLAATRADAAVANLFAAEISRRMFGYLDELAGNTFGTMRQRVARHLLDLAATDRERPLVARVSQQALADAVGTAREVVVRVLRDLREEGLVKTSRDRIELLHPDRLVAETFPRED